MLTKKYIAREAQFNLVLAGNSFILFLSYADDVMYSKGSAILYKLVKKSKDEKTPFLIVRTDAKLIWKNVDNV